MGAQTRVYLNVMHGVIKMNKSETKEDNNRKELRVYIGSNQGEQELLSRWIFLERLRLCFRFKANNGGEWQNIEYDRGLEICKRIAMNAGDNVKVSGSLVEELQKEAMVSELFSKGKIVIGMGGVQ